MTNNEIFQICKEAINNKEYNTLFFILDVLANYYVDQGYADSGALLFDILNKMRYAEIVEYMAYTRYDIIKEKVNNYINQHYNS